MTLHYTIELRGGLANRLRTLWAAHAFASKQQKPILAIWPILPELGCCWRSLLTLTPPVKLMTANPTRIVNQKALSLCRLTLSTFGLGLNRASEPGIPWVHPPRYRDRRFIPFQWIQTCEEFENTSTIDPPFKPTPQVAHSASRRLAQIRDKYPSLTGVHIRRGDHQRAIKASTLDHFKTAIQRQIDTMASSAFLVCTDSDHEASELKSLFGRRIFWHPPRSLNRNEPTSIQDAMVDLIALSQCDQMIGSYLSSFSILAARYGSIHLQIACESVDVALDH